MCVIFPSHFLRYRLARFNRYEDIEKWHEKQANGRKLWFFCVWFFFILSISQWIESVIVANVYVFVYLVFSVLILFRVKNSSPEPEMNGKDECCGIVGLIKIYGVQTCSTPSQQHSTAQLFTHKQIVIVSVHLFSTTNLYCILYVYKHDSRHIENRVDPMRHTHSS